MRRFPSARLLTYHQLLHVVQNVIRKTPPPSTPPSSSIDHLGGELLPNFSDLILDPDRIREQQARRYQDLTRHFDAHTSGVAPGDEKNETPEPDVMLHREPRLHADERDDHHEPPSTPPSSGVIRPTPLHQHEPTPTPPHQHHGHEESVVICGDSAPPPDRRRAHHDNEDDGGPPDPSSSGEDDDGDDR